MGGGPMPYVLDTGPYLSVLEGRVNDPARRTSILTSLRNGDPLATIAGLDSTTLDADGKLPHERVEILNQCWFGMSSPSPGRWTKQPNAFPTGFWQGYQGDPEAILREGLIRAIEVAYGIDHGIDPSAHSREWPVAITWICQGPFFQCWVSWMKASSGTGGHVALTITTPAAKGLPVDHKITRSTMKPEYACPPPANAYAAARGMWVLGHEDYDKSIQFSFVGSNYGAILEPRVQWKRKKTDVVCVAPAEWEGGVLASGRHYSPPATP